MTIGEKITKLRAAAHISQEQLAEKLNVSRQSVCKWEADQALPQIDKVLQLCELFSVSADALLKDSITIDRSEDGEEYHFKYFGTDGFRGEANVSLTSMHAYKVGRFLGWYFTSELCKASRPNHRTRVVIGKDTRRSSYMLEYAIAVGLTASGADAYMLHVTTTPSVSFATRQDDFDCGVMITASHNPFTDNGIKIINRYGEKLDDKTTEYIERYIDGDLTSLGVTGSDLPLACGEKLGRIVDYVSGRNRYLGYLISLASNSYKKLRIGLDCANGASWMIAKSVFDALGAQTVVIGAEPDGLNVNDGCGSTHVEKLCRLVRDEHLDVGFAFDGDADRCIAVDENGNIVDGDKIMYILGKRLKDKGMLNGETVVATIMSNSGLKESLKKIGIEYAETTVGDRFIYECMQKNDFSLGGEQSGHIIIKKYATTGDGILTAIMLTEEICDRKSSLGKLADPVKLYPQHLENLRVKNKAAVINDEAVQEKIKEVDQLINGKGRVLLRQSGTEPVIRIMIEAETEEKSREYAEMVADVVKERGHCVG